MRFLILLAMLSFAASAQTAPDWQTATELPNVDFSGLSPAQVKLALKVLREEGCICGCNMKLAQCRIADPACSDSKPLAALIVKSAREGKTAEQIRADLGGSDLAKTRAAARRAKEGPFEIPTKGAPVRGPANARIALVEFSDFECPFCSKAAAELNAVLRAYPKDVKLTYKQFPLDMHPHGKLAAAASLAARDQDKFWPMHDKLFANFRKLSRENIIAWAGELGLDTAKFTADLDSGKYTMTIDKDIADAEKIYVSATPTIFLNGKRYDGPVDVASMKRILDTELAK